ncbi:Uncharacterized protein APZ42_032538 [Daphnia magna]|uniref:Secreted protein n=1 Tax=Daphnia magna TaxID=35525 RepID=A0A0P4ZUQ0_9CRUS|nr:Uncharacterized protein APZ42_032538 [Daphnia magna]
MIMFSHPINKKVPLLLFYLILFTPITCGSSTQKAIVIKQMFSIAESFACCLFRTQEKRNVFLMIFSSMPKVKTIQ